jgi:SAM-dependent methyltransferase
MFRHSFEIGPETRILDLGGSDGAHIAAVLARTDARAANCVVADVDPVALKLAEARGFSTIPLRQEDATLPFADREFDIVFCSSVLEHVTFPYPQIWTITSGLEFRSTALRRQAAFASEIRRIGKGHFVQVPYRHFPLETHTRTLLFQYLPRGWQVGLLKLRRAKSAQWIPWVRHSRKVTPDFYLPTDSEFASFFPASTIRRERMFGFTKSLIAIAQG